MDSRDEFGSISVKSRAKWRLPEGEDAVIILEGRRSRERKACFFSFFNVKLELNLYEYKMKHLEVVSKFPINLIFFNLGVSIRLPTLFFRPIFSFKF